MYPTLHWRIESWFYSKRMWPIQIHNTTQICKGIFLHLCNYIWNYKVCHSSHLCKCQTYKIRQCISNSLLVLFSHVKAFCTTGFLNVCCGWWSKNISNIEGSVWAIAIYSVLPAACSFLFLCLPFFVSLLSLTVKRHIFRRW